MAPSDWSAQPSRSSAGTAGDMPQLLTGRIFELPNSTSAAPLLLRLPSHIRLHIYGYLGVLPGLGRQYPYGLSRVPISYPEFHPYGQRWAPNTSGFLALLLSCRLIYAEVIPLFYRTHPFVIYFSHRYHCQPQPDPEEPENRPFAATCARFTP